jgi:hypothetical protein
MFANLTNSSAPFVRRRLQSRAARRKPIELLQPDDERQILDPTTDPNFPKTILVAIGA